MHRTTAEGNVGNLFSAGNPGLGIKATRVTADMMNSFQEELCNVVVDSGQTLDAGNDHQLTAAIKLLNISLPSGSLAPRSQLTPNMTVKVLAGYIYNGQTLTSIAQQTSAAIAAPTTNPRIDRVVANESTGVISVITGTQAASPVAPAVSAGNLPIAQIALVVGQTSIVDQNITDERAFHFVLPASSQAAPGLLELATTAEVKAGTDTARVASVNEMKNHANMVRASGSVSSAGALLGTDYIGVSSVGYSSGTYTVTLSVTMSDANYAVSMNIAENVGCTQTAKVSGKTTTSFQYTIYHTCDTGTAVQQNATNFIVTGKLA